MTDPPDLTTLARRYLDLWQEHLGTMARDPAVSDALARSFSLMTQGLADAARATPAAAAPATAPDGEGHAHSEPPAEPGREPADAAGDGPAESGGHGHAGRTTAAGPAPGDPGPADDELANRVERLEQRVALLEAALGGVLAGVGRGRGDS